MIIIRYFGGKQRIADYISGYINQISGYNKYVEPFCGSCNVASKVNIPNKILNDKHPYLIAMFKALQEGWIPPDIVTEEQYQKIRLNQEKIPHIAGFVGFGCSFSGKWWGGYAKSKDRNYAKNAHNSILKKMATLQDSEFLNKDFYELDFKNSIIYCDPPYKNTTQYSKKILGDFQYDEFLKWAKKQSKENIILISEYKHNTPEDATILLEINSKTDIRNKLGEKNKTIEVLYTYNKLNKNT